MKKLLLALALLTSITANASDFARSCTVDRDPSVSVIFTYNADGQATMMVGDNQSQDFIQGRVTYKNPFKEIMASEANAKKFRFFSAEKINAVIDLDNTGVITEIDKESGVQKEHPISCHGEVTTK